MLVPTAALPTTYLRRCFEVSCLTQRLRDLGGDACCAEDISFGPSKGQGVAYNCSPPGTTCIQIGGAPGGTVLLEQNGEAVLPADPPSAQYQLHDALYNKQ